MIWGCRNNHCEKTGLGTQQHELDTPKTAVHEQIGERTLGFSLPSTEAAEPTQMADCIKPLQNTKHI
jgi:hypothetical protein